MLGSKFEIDIIEGSLISKSAISNDQKTKLCKFLNIQEDKLENILLGNSKETLICEEENVSTALEILNALGISAEAQLQEASNTDSLFGSLNIASNGLSFDIEEEENSSPKQIESKIEEKSKTKAEKTTHVIDNSLLFDDDEDNDTSSLDKILEEFDEKEDIIEDKKPVEVKSNSYQAQAIAAFESAEFPIKEDTNNPATIEARNEEQPKIINRDVNNLYFVNGKYISEEEFNNTKLADIPSKDEDNCVQVNSEIKDKSKKNNKVIVIALLCISIISIMIYFLFFNEDPEANNQVVSQISKIISDKDNQKSNDKLEKKAKEIVIDNYEGSMSLNSFESKINVKVANKIISGVQLEIENKNIGSPSENEYVSGKFIPRLTALRLSYEKLDTSEENTIEGQLRVTYIEGTINKKAISKAFVSYNEQDKSIIVSTADVSVNNVEPHIAYNIKENDTSATLDMYLKIPLTSIVNNTQDRSISDLIDSQIKMNKPPPAKEKKAPTKKGVDEQK